MLRDFTRSKATECGQTENWTQFPWFSEALYQGMLSLSYQFAVISEKYYISKDVWGSQSFENLTST